MGRESDDNPRTPPEKREYRRLEREELKEKIRELEGELQRKEAQLEALRRGRGGALPSELESFVSDHVSSVESLEILLVFQAHPERGWSVQELTKKVGSSALLVEKRLNELTQGGILLRKGGPPIYSLSESTPSINDILGRLAKACSSDRAKVVDVVLSKHRHAARDFAAAFRMRRDIKEDTT